MRKGINIALIAGLGAAAVVLALMLVMYFLETELAVWMLIAFPLAVFIIGFLVALLLANTLVKEKITPFEHTLPGSDAAENINTGSVPEKDIDEKASDNIREGTEEKKTELEKLKGLETYRKEFLGNIYHELKTPIFNIQGYILTLMEGGLDDPDINKLYLERTEQNINRLISVVDDLESISGLESGSLNLKIEKFNIKKIIKEVFEHNEIRAKKLNIKLETGKTRESAETVRADKKWIFQVLNNLIMNSINYGVKNGRTTVNLKLSGDKVYIEVKDNGIGISDEHVHRIFERFYRVDKSRSRDTGGTGLGLSIVKHIIEAHKQTIQVKSVPGKGSSFTFTLDRV